MSVQDRLKKILGPAYGGPSLSIDGDGDFVLYMWSDAPVAEHVLEKADTLKGVVEAYEGGSDNAKSSK